MTTATHPIISPHRIVIALITAAVLMGLTAVVVVGLVASGSSTPPPPPAAAPASALSGPRFVGTVNSGPDNPSRLTSTLCRDFANATPGSRAAFRLAETISFQGGC